MNELANKRLEEKVRATNRLNEICNYWEPILQALVRPMVGHKVTKKDNSLTESFKKTLPKLPTWSETNNQENIYYRPNQYYISFTVQVSTSRGNIEQGIYVANVRDHIIESIYDTNPPRRTDYTAKEILDARAEVDKYQALAREAESKIAQFGLNDY